MFKVDKKIPKYIALALGLILIFQTAVIAMSGTDEQPSDSQSIKAEYKNNDLMTAAELSKLSGATVDTIMELKKQKGEWNDVIEILKNDPKYKSGFSQADMDSMLSTSGLTDEDISKLKEQSYEDRDIIEAKALVERIQYQLGEVKRRNVETSLSPEASINNTDVNEKEGDLAIYYKVLDSMNLKVAVTLLLMLRSEFGSFEAVLDEYLLSLQLEINLEDYLKDKEAYKKLKQEKSMTIAPLSIVTMARIEEMMLKALYQTNKTDTNMILTPNLIPTTYSEGKGMTPVVTVPDVSSPKPENPLDNITNEINGINNRSMNGQ